MPPMAVDAPRNNLQDVLRRNASSHSTVPTASSTPTTQASGSKKFKPAKPIQPFPAPLIIPMLNEDGSPPVRTHTPRPLSPVRTPQKRQPPVIDLSSPEPPSSSVPRKRHSSEAPGVFESASSASKRAKRANKENQPSSSGHRAEDDVDMSDFGEPSHLLATRPRAQEPATPRRRRRDAPPSDAKPQEGMSHADLDNKSVPELETLLQHNKKRRFQTMEDLVNSMDKPGVDKAMLRAIDTLVKDRIAAIETAIDVAKGLRPKAGPSLDIKDEVPTEPNTPSQEPSRSQIPKPRRHQSPTPTPSYPRGDPSVMEIETISSTRASDASSSTLPSSSEPAPVPAPVSRPFKKVPSIIDLASDDEDSFWNNVDEVSADDYRTQLQLPIAPIEAPMSAPLPPQNEEQPAPEPDASPSASASTAVDRADRDAYASPYYPEIIQKLKSTFKLHSFRPNQLKAITATMSGKDVFVLMPTGGGKSLCYQLPAICNTGRTRGVTFVISPLLALMNDQVRALKKLNISVVVFSSEQTAEERRHARDSLLQRGGRKPSMVYITPEGIEKNVSLGNILNNLYKNKELARFVIDEAHLISSWGRDFRESYQFLGSLRDNYPDVPIMALTATVNELGKSDIVQRLHIDGCQMLTSSFNRSNLHYRVMPGKAGLIEKIANYIRSNHPEATGVIYCLARTKCEEMAKALREQYGLSAWHFHAGMATEDKRQVQDNWYTGKVRIIVATIAFGMGIDKADVRYVIHVNVPKSLDGYYQETGRAGRDGKPADCIMYWNQGDRQSLHAMIDKSKEVPLEERKRQKDEVNEVIAYCENTVTCRRVQVLKHFGQEFNSADCHKHCDNCMDDTSVVTVDMTDLSIKAIQLATSLLKTMKNVTKVYVGDLLRGAKTKVVLDNGHDKQPGYGAGKDMKNRLDRLLSELETIQAFKSKVVTNKGGFGNHYLTLGHRAHDITSGRYRVKIEFRDDNKSAAPRSRKAKEPTIIKPKGKGKGRADEDEGIEDYSEQLDDTFFQDMEDDIVDDEPVSAPVPPRRATHNSRPGPSRSAPSLPVPSSASSSRPPPPSASDSADVLHAQHLDALRAWRGEVAAQEDCNDEDVLTDEVLQMLVLMPPTDVASVEAALTNWMTPRTEEARADVKLRAEKFGPRILSIFATDQTSPPIFSRPPAPAAPPPAAAAPARVRSFKPVELHQRFDYNGAKR